MPTYEAVAQACGKFLKQSQRTDITWNSLGKIKLKGTLEHNRGFGGKKLKE